MFGFFNVLINMSCDMKTFDLTEIRNRLKHGDLSKIATRLKLQPRIVSEVFIEGWHASHRNAVVKCALELIKGQNENPEVLEEADKMKLATESFMSLPSGKRKSKHRNFGRKNKPGGVWKVVAGVGIAVVAVFIVLPKLGIKLFQN